jgi:hypothetical protein
VTPGFEQGPIRPPSEAGSLLVRVSRNCPWNRCAFCPVYKGECYSRRPVGEVLADLEEMAAWYGDVPRTAFLQDADPLQAPPEDVLSILGRMRELFPRLTRITAYARSRTLVRRGLPDLRRLREAGLSRIHTGFESGSDRVLSLMDKGATREQHLAAGRLAKEAGFCLSVYVMPGLGGRALSSEHADETASLVAAVNPDFTRLRTTAPVPGTPLHTMAESGAFVPLSEAETVGEIRRFLAGLGGAATRIESDHVLNLLLYLRGDLPGDHARLLALCDEFLDLPPADRALFVLGRRTGRLRRPKDLDLPGAREQLSAALAALRASGEDPESLFSTLRRAML